MLTSLDGGYIHQSCFTWEVTYLQLGSPTVCVWLCACICRQTANIFIIS